MVSIMLGAWPPVTSQAHAQTPSGSIVGVWTLNKAQSDAPPEQMPDVDSDHPGGAVGSGGGGFGRRGGGLGRGDNVGRNGGRGSRDDVERMRAAMRDVTDTPARLTIVQTPSMVIITTGDGRTTRLSPDGKTIKDDSTNVQRRSKWDGGRLVTEITGIGPGKITETYAVDPERRRLNVTIQMENARAARGITIHRVYDAEAR